VGFDTHEPVASAPSRRRERSREGPLDHGQRAAPRSEHVAALALVEGDPTQAKSTSALALSACIMSPASKPGDDVDDVTEGEIDARDRALR
jgi:hypothetical protein